MKSALCFTFLFTSLLNAQVTLDKAHFVKNRGDGYCGWCCLEMACLNLGYDHLKGLTTRRESTYHNDGSKLTKTEGGATIFDLMGELDYQKIGYWHQFTGNKDPKLLDAAIAAKLPCIIAVNDYPSRGDNHAILLVDISKDNSNFIDPNLDHKTITKTRAWLMSHWTGYTIVLEHVPDAFAATKTIDDAKTIVGPPPLSNHKTVTKTTLKGEYYARPIGVEWSTRPATVAPSKLIRP